MCTRIKYETGTGAFITGRCMDWNDPTAETDLWTFPKEMQRNGGVGPDSVTWTSKYGSVATSFYGAAGVDGVNEAGFVANLLYLAEADYGDVAERGKPTLSVGAWLQYLVDNYATVAAAVEAMKGDPLTIVAPLLPNGRPAAGHVAISDASGDSAILEYLDGKLVIHHSPEYTVMTNSPTYDQQLAINAYWELIGGDRMLPGTINAADRYVRASYFLNSSPRYADSLMAVASVFSQMRAIGVPLGMSDPDHPNISATLWRVVVDHEAGRLYFESAIRPSVFWVDLDAVDIGAGAGVMRLKTLGPDVLAGEVSSEFETAEPFEFLAP